MAQSRRDRPVIVYEPLTCLGRVKTECAEPPCPRLKAVAFKRARSNAAALPSPLGPQLDGQMSQEVNGILIGGQLHRPTVR